MSTENPTKPLSPFQPPAAQRAEESPAPASAPQTQAPEERPDELALLKDRARVMGITFSNNIGVEALKQKINDKITGDRQAEPRAPTPAADEPGPAAMQPERKLTEHELRQKLKAEATKLIRVRITCLDPKKKDLHGEVITVANRFVGTIRKFIPFGEATDNGYHVPNIIYEMLRDRKFCHVRVTKGPNGQEQVKVSDEREFSIEVLPPLTQKDLDRLAVKQAAAEGKLDLD